MKRIVFAGLLLSALVVGLNVGFVHWNPAMATTPPPCQFLGIDQSGTTINTTIVCVTPIASGGGVVTVKATATSCGQPVQPSPTAGAVVVEVPVCATSAPQNTASPTATSTSTAGAPSLTFSGSFPYTLTAEFPSGGAGAGAFIRSGTAASWLAYVETLSSVTHIWPMSDASGCNTIADVVAGGATAAPSPVPLATPTASPDGIACGGPGISHDGNTSLVLSGLSGASYVTVPTSAVPINATDWTLCGAQNVVVSPNIASNTHGVVWAFEANSDLLNYLYSSSGTLIPNIDGANDAAIFDSGVSSEYDCITVNHTTTLDTIYINGVIVYSADNTAVDAKNGLDFGNGSAIGGQNWPFNGRMCCFVLANTVLTQAQIEAMTAALGY